MSEEELKKIEEELGRHSNADLIRRLVSEVRRLRAVIEFDYGPGTADPDGTESGYELPSVSAIDDEDDE